MAYSISSLGADSQSKVRQINKPMLNNQVNDTSPEDKTEVQNVLTNTVRQPRCDALYHEVPEWMRDNDYLMSGYRMDYEGSSEVASTLCKCHNETINIWTHLTGSLIMLTFGILYIIFHENHTTVGQVGWQLYQNEKLSTENLQLQNFIDEFVTQYQQKVQEFQTVSSQSGSEQDIFKALIDVTDHSEQCAYLLTKNSKQIVESSDNLEDEQWNKLLNSIKTYENHNEDLVASITKSNKFESLNRKVQSKIDRIKVLNKGMSVLSSTVKDTHDRIESIKNSPKLKDLIIVDKLLVYIPSWPLVAHLFSGFFCLGFSAMFHLFWIQSKYVCDWMARLDYGGICVLVMGSSYPPIFYLFSCGPVLTGRNFFLFLITCSSSLVFLMLMVPKMNQPKFRMCRALSFIFLGLSGGLPFFYILLMKENYQQYYLPTLSIWPWFIGGQFYICGALMFGFRIPEKFYPYTFDIYGSSHQYLHIGVIIGFAIMFNDALRLYQVNKEFVCPIEVPKTF